MTKILLVEDSRDFAEMLREAMERDGYDVVVAVSGPDGPKAAIDHSPDLIVLDVMLPGIDGFTVLQRIRDSGNDVPVVMMTARGTEDDKLRAFALAADDYIVKPCGRREILARIAAVLRRVRGDSATRPTIFRLLDLEIDLGKQEVRRDGLMIPLRRKLFDLLAALARHRGHVVSRANLLRDVWGYANGTESRTLETHVTILRQQLGDDPASPRYIITVRGVGYRLGGVEDA